MLACQLPPHLERQHLRLELLQRSLSLFQDIVTCFSQVLEVFQDWEIDLKKKKIQVFQDAWEP